MITSHTTADMFEVMLLEVKRYLSVRLNLDWKPNFSMSDNCDAIMDAVSRIWPDIVKGELHLAGNMIIINYILQGA